MTEQVDRLWQALEAMPAPAAVEVEWRNRLGDEFDRLAPFMKPEQSLSAAYPCYGVADFVCIHDVVHHDDGSIVAACRGESCSCGNRALRREDIIVYRLDVAALCRSIAALFGIAPGANQLTEMNGVYGVGLLEGAERRPVVFLLPEPEVAPDVALERLLGRSGAMPFTCLVPTMAGITGDVSMRLANVGATAIACSDFIGWDEDNNIALRLPRSEMTAKLGGERRPSEVREPRAQYVVASPHCLLIDARGERAMTVDEYQALNPEDLDLFIDMTTTVSAGRYRASRRGENGAFQDKPLTKNQAAALVELVVRGKALRPTELDTIDVAHPDKAVEKARANVDVRVSRYEWRSFKTLTDRDSTAKRYIFNPPADLRYAIIRPVTVTGDK